MEIDNTPLTTQETAPHPSSDPGILARLAASPTSRNLVFLAASLLGGGGILSISGCAQQESSYDNQVQAARVLEKEAKFSTLPANTKVSIGEMPQLLANRQEVAKSLEPSIAAMRSLVTQVDAGQVVDGKLLDTAKEGMTKLTLVLMDAKSSKTYEGATEEIDTISAKTREFNLLNAADFKEGTVSKGYTEAQKLLSSLYEWNNAIERDIGNLKQGVHAGKVAALESQLELVEVQLKQIQSDTSITGWVAHNPEQSKAFMVQLKAAVQGIDGAIALQEFASISPDLSDAKKRLKDVETAVPTKDPASLSAPSNSDAKAELALVKEAYLLVHALRKDLGSELQNTLGVQVASPTTNTQPQGSSQPQGSGQPQVVHHHDAGMNPFLLYMLLNNQRGYGGGYNYTPSHTPTYSGSNRLRTSTEYGSFSKESEQNHSTFSGRSGFTSHSSGPLGRAAPSTSSSSSFSGSSSSHSQSGSSHVTPSTGSRASSFNAGRSTSSGFGG